MVAVVGAPHPGLLRALGRAPNVVAVGDVADGGLQAAVSVLRRAESVNAPYAVIGLDPLDELRAQWVRMWEVRAGSHAFEETAGRAVTAWRAGDFELPDYYVVVAEPAPQAQTLPHHDDWHLGVLRAARPGRVVALAPGSSLAEEAARVLHALSGLPQGPWWPPLDELVARARSYYPGSIDGSAAAEVL